MFRFVMLDEPNRLRMLSGSTGSRAPGSGGVHGRSGGGFFHARDGGRRHAFTMVELLTVIAILGVLLAILLPVLGRARTAGQSVTCLSNLRQISIGFQLFAEQNNNTLPDPAQTQVSWEQSISPYVQIRTAFNCPADSELFAAVGSSYDWRDTGKPDTTLAGRDLNSIRRSDAVMAFDALPAWHTRNWLNVVRVDGSALSMNQDEWFTNMDLSVQAMR